MAQNKALTAYIASLEADRDRLDTAQKLFFGWDAEWGVERVPVVLLRYPKGVRTNGDIRQFLDDAKAATKS